MWSADADSVVCQAQKSPLALAGTKAALLHRRDHGVHVGLEWIAMWNAAQLMSADLQESFKALGEKRRPLYARL